MDISSLISYVMAVKEESEVHTMKRAFQVTLDVFSKYLRDQIMDIVDADKKVCHVMIVPLDVHVPYEVVKSDLIYR